MAEKRDYYEVLGVSRDASPEEIKKSYRRLARQLHPDVNHTDPQAEESFKELGEAYDALSDPQKRAAYDRYGHAGLSGATGGYPGGQAPFDEMFGDILGGFFGGGMRGNNRVNTRGADLRYDLEVTLNEAAFGGERTFRYNHQTSCPTCTGSGSTTGRVTTCLVCGGSGQRQANAGFLGMQFTTVTPCERCGSTGQIITDPCTKCNGVGRVRTTEEMTVTVPQGVDSGMYMEFSGRGDAGLRNGPPGDLAVVFRVRQHEIFKRQNADLICEVPLAFTTATLGGKLTVPTLDGDAEVDVPPGTQPGHIFHLRGKGMPVQRGTQRSEVRGDEHVVVSIAVPTDLSATQRELLRTLAVERGENIDHKSKNVFQKVVEAVEDAVDDYRDRAKEAFGG